MTPIPTPVGPPAASGPACRSTASTTSPTRSVNGRPARCGSSNASSSRRRSGRPAHDLRTRRPTRPRQRARTTVPRHPRHERQPGVARRVAGLRRPLRQTSRSPVGYAEITRGQHAFDAVPSVRTGHVISGVERFLVHIHATHQAAALAAGPINAGPHAPHSPATGDRGRRPAMTIDSRLRGPTGSAELRSTPVATPAHRRHRAPDEGAAASCGERRVFGGKR